MGHMLELMFGMPCLKPLNVHHRQRKEAFVDFPDYQPPTCLCVEHQRNALLSCTESGGRTAFASCFAFAVDGRCRDMSAASAFCRLHGTRVQVLVRCPPLDSS